LPRKWRKKEDKAVPEKEPGEGRERRVRRIRQGGEEAPQSQGSEEDPLQKVRRAGRKIAEELRGSVGGSQDVSDQIRRLAELRDEGHISSEEFEAKKRELLKRM
jgi:hypothetical protein